MGYLDNAGLTYFWGKIKAELDKKQDSGGTSGLITWDDIIGRPDVSSLADLSVNAVKLTAAGWANKQQIAAVPGIKAEENSQLIIIVPASSDFETCKASNVIAAQQQTGKLLFQCDTQPASDVNLNVFVFDSKNVSTGMYEWFNPEMTGNNTPKPYAATASSEFNFNYAAYRAFDGTNGYYWLSLSINQEWIQFDFGAKTGVGGLRLQSTNSVEKIAFPKKLMVYGSDDNVKFQPIAEWKLPVVTPENGVYYEVLFDKRVDYRYYRLSDFETINNEIGRVQIASIEFFKYGGGA